MPDSATPAARERILTRPLLAFLAGVAVLLLLGPLTRCAPHDVAGLVRQLGDGDLDGDERQVALDRLIALAAQDATPLAQWARLLAGIERGDRPAHAASLQALGGAPERQLPPIAQQRFLHLGNPLLGNVLAAAVAEAAADRAAAQRRWQQVAVQAVLAHQPFAGELAAAALARLR